MFEDTKQSVPVFNDKHLAATWEDAKWMYDRARKLFVPLLAGSSIPVTWRKPNLVLPKDCELVGAVQIGYGPFEAYGFHALEGLQCMVERRKGGETGVKAVTCHSPQDDVGADRQARVGEAGAGRGAEVGAGARDRGRARIDREDRGRGRVRGRVPRRAARVRRNAQRLGVRRRRRRVHLRAASARGRRSRTRASSTCSSPESFAHFAELTKAIDALVNTGHAPYPVERTLLTTGVLDAVMTSRHEKNKRVETPHLEIAYKPTEWGPAKGDVPKPDKK